jgi:hypothetical protein
MKQMVSHNEELCRLLENIGCLRAKFDNELAVHLELLHENQISIVADFTGGTPGPNEPLTRDYKCQRYLVWVLLRRHFVKIGGELCEVTYDEHDLRT